MNIDKYKKNFIFLVKTLGDINNIVEIGAHYGEDSIRFHKYFPNANIYCFEPDPRNIEIFKKTCKNIKNIKLIPNAISNKNTKLSFYQAYEKFDEEILPEKYKFIDINLFKKLKLNNSGSSSLKKSNRKDLINSKEIKVDSITLNKWFNNEKIKNIDFLWIDVQGAEKEVIVGCKSILHKIKFIQLEYGETSYEEALSKKETYNMMIKLGFKLIHDYNKNKSKGDFLFKNKNYK